MNGRMLRHPILDCVQQLKEQGIVLLDNVTSFPVYDDPMTSPNLVVALNMRGWLECEYDTKSVKFEAQDVAVVMPNHTIKAIQSSDDYCAMLLVMSPEAYTQMKFVNPRCYQDGFLYHDQAHFRLYGGQFESIRSAFTVLRAITDSSRLRHTTIVSKALDVLFCLLLEFRKTNCGDLHQPTQHEQILASFIDAVSQHYTESREVRYYADMFCLSPKYFAAIIKQQTGVNASDWISNYVEVQAKMLLRYHRNLSIQQVALKLGFEDQASFCRFFKRKTGQSPSRYR